MVLLLVLLWPVVEKFGPAIMLSPQTAESLCRFYLFFNTF
jgi:hypothetical protein